MTKKFDLDIIQRTLKTTGVLLLIILVVGTMYFGFYDALAVFSGGIWSMLNFIFLAALIRSALRPEKVDKASVITLALIKFPLLYVAGYFLLTIEFFRPVPLVIGISSVLLVLLLKTVGRVILNLDVLNSHKSSKGLA